MIGGEIGNVIKGVVGKLVKRGWNGWVVGGEGLYVEREGVVCGDYN